MDIPPPKEDIPTRYRVVIRDFPPRDKILTEYFVCTIFGERKAVALAIAYDLKQRSKGRVFDIPVVEQLGHGNPKPDDLVDRMEW